MIDEALYQLVNGVAGVSNRVAPSTDTTADKATPRLVYTLISDARSYTDDGVCGLRKATYQLDAFGDKLSDARGVIARVTAPTTATTPGLDGYRGTIAGVVIQRVYFSDEHFNGGTNSPGQNTTVARATVDVLIDYRTV